MLKWLTPESLAQTYRDPVSWAILAVDLFPVYAVFQFGWDATSLVFLYWLENLIIGAMTLLRMVATSTAGGILGVGSVAFMGPFFTFHYGMFCFVHGIFLAVFAAASRGGMDEADFMGPFELTKFALSTGDQMTLFVAAIIALQLFLFATDFIGTGAFRTSDVAQEMMKPYGRIVLLHFALFAGFGVMLWIGQPMIGVLGLILLRAVWGVYQSYRRHVTPSGQQTPKVDEPSPF